LEGQPSKLVGGWTIRCDAGDGQTPTQIVAPANSESAGSGGWQTLKPEVLALPEPLLKMIPTASPDYERGGAFQDSTSPAFDALAQRKQRRSTRCSFYSIRNVRRGWWSFMHGMRITGIAGKCWTPFIGATWKRRMEKVTRSKFANGGGLVVLYDLMQLAANDHATDEVRAIARLELDDLKRWVYGPLPTIKGSCAY